MPSTYKQAVNYLLEQLPMFQRVGAAAYRSDLTNIIKLCEVLGNPQQHLKCIHIAGTNGKGSVSHIIASILQAQGYKVGLFVSPHYKDYRERIKINGKLISKRFVSNFVEQNQPKFKSIQASFFEISTAMAFQYFTDKKVDYAVIETGMGGRLDSTNIITPLLSVITNISYDHQQFLGNTLPKIATEKAGIIKQHTPVVIGETQKQTRSVFTKAAKQAGAKIYFADKQLKPVAYKSDLTGGYQKKNITTALMAVEVLKQLDVSIADKAIKEGLKHVRKNTAFIGRWMQVSQKPLTIFDSAHNQAGIGEVVNQLSATTYNKLHFVFGTVADKDISKVLALLPNQAQYYFCKANIPRGLDAASLQQQALKYGLKGSAYPSVKAAYKQARKTAGKKDLILVSGSVFVVAELV